MTATLLAASALLSTLFFALALLAFTFLSLAISLLTALLPRSTRFAWFVRILLSFHITFRGYITNFSLIFPRFAIRPCLFEIALEGPFGLQNLSCPYQVLGFLQIDQ